MHSIIFHAHQKLDRVAHRHLKQLLPSGGFFPSIRQVLHFEAGHGPDGAKLKRLKDGSQPWHFVDPHDANDTHLHEQIEHHYTELVSALKAKDEARSAWQAAWLAHALVDGLTPAHHYPYEAELSQLRGGEARHTRKGLTGRLYVEADTLGKSFMQSLKLVGPKGLLTNHAMFEAGAFAIIAPLKLSKGRPSKQNIDDITAKGVVTVFKQMAKEVAGLNIYDRFCERGWTQNVSRDVRRELAPRMVQMITLAWYAASYEATKRPV
jgi:hypothetical protein